MSDLELLFLVLALLYGWECACWLRTGSVGFVTWLGNRWRLAQPGALLGNPRGGFILAPPLPPLGTVLVGQACPLRFAKEGVLPDATQQPGAGNQTRVMRWNDIKTITVTGKKIALNGQTFLKASSAPSAFRLARQLEAFRSLDPDKRPKAIETFLRQSLDVKAAEQRWTEFNRLAAPLHLLANAVFIFLFVFTPMVIWRVGFLRTWPGLLAGLLALTGSAAVAFRRIHKTLYPEAGDDRFTHSLITLLSPATTPRARDVLSRPLLEAFHPLALAKAFCPEPEFRAAARRVLIELKYPAPAAERNAPFAAEIEREFQAAWAVAVEQFLQQHKLKEKELLAPPARKDESCRTFCPRCEEQFTRLEGVCADCGVRLQPL